MPKATLNLVYLKDSVICTSLQHSTAILSTNFLIIRLISGQTYSKELVQSYKYQKIILFQIIIGCIFT